MTNMYREVLYLYSATVRLPRPDGVLRHDHEPGGLCGRAPAEYVCALFEYISPILGDDLTNSEDIFIGFSMLNEGYRNIQLTDVYARTVEPEIQKLPRQVYLWSSSFLQSCYYFDRSSAARSG